MRGARPKLPDSAPRDLPRLFLHLAHLYAKSPAIPIPIPIPIAIAIGYQASSVSAQSIPAGGRAIPPVAPRSLQSRRNLCHHVCRGGRDAETKSRAGAATSGAGPEPELAGRASIDGSKYG